MQDFHKLKVWSKSHDLTLRVYETTKRFPREEAFGLTAQLRGAASSIGSNIAEGCGRKGDPEFARFLNIAFGSASELEYRLLLAHDLKLLTPPQHNSLRQDTQEVKKMLGALIRKLRAES